MCLEQHCSVAWCFMTNRTMPEKWRGLGIKFWEQRPRWSEASQSTLRNSRFYLRDFEESPQTSLSQVQLFCDPWTVDHQAPLSIEFSRQEYWSRLPFPTPSEKTSGLIENPALTMPLVTMWEDLWSWGGWGGAAHG